MVVSKDLYIMMRDASEAGSKHLYFLIRENGKASAVSKNPHFVTREARVAILIDLLMRVAREAVSSGSRY